MCPTHRHYKSLGSLASLMLLASLHQPLLITGIITRETGPTKTLGASQKQLSTLICYKYTHFGVFGCSDTGKPSQFKHSISTWREVKYENGIDITTNKLQLAHQHYIKLWVNNSAEAAVTKEVRFILDLKKHILFYTFNPFYMDNSSKEKCMQKYVKLPYGCMILT